MSQDKIQKARELVLNYISTHTLSDKLNRAVNEVCRSRPKDPWLTLSDIVSEWIKDVPIVDRLVAKQGIDSDGILSLQLQLFGRVSSTRPPRFIGHENVFIIHSNTKNEDVDDDKSSEATNESMMKKVSEFLSPALRSIRIDEQSKIDQELSKLYADGLQEESNKYNIIPTISSLIADSAAKHLRMPLFRYLICKRKEKMNDSNIKCVLPNIMVQLTKSVSNRLPSICMISKKHLRPIERIQMMTEIAKQLIIDLQQTKGRKAMFDGNTGAILIEDTDCMNTEELLQLVNTAIVNTLEGKYEISKDLALCLSFANNPSVIEYNIEHKRYRINENIYGNIENVDTNQDVIEYFNALLTKHKEIECVEDPLNDTNEEMYAALNEKLDVVIIGNGLYSSMIASIEHGIKSRLSSAAAISTKEIFTVSNALNISNMIQQLSDNKMLLVLCDNFNDNALSTYAVDLSVACNAEILQLSLPNSGKSKDKYNRWLMIADDLLDESEFVQSVDASTTDANVADDSNVNKTNDADKTEDLP